MTRSPDRSHSRAGLSPALLTALLPALSLLLLTACRPDSSGGSGEADATVGTDEAGVVNLYTARHYDGDEVVYERFTSETGIRVELLEADSAALLERLTREGADSPADLFITVDAGRLHQAEQAGAFQPVRSAVLEERIPEKLRHPEGLWFGLTKRARVIVYAKDRVDPSEITTYEDLADPRWKGRIAIRSSTNVYNQSLVASLIAALGEEATEEWCRGLVANLARPPQGGDRDQIRAVAAGEADIAVSNTYYLAQMLAGSEEDRAAAARVGVVFPNQGGRGTHVNISGGGVVAGAPNRDNAVRLLEFLAGPEAQSALVAETREYPVAAGYEAVPELE
ncbi:MAG: extracellular solute-binding protein, partial [Acidobacteria bacterium]